MSNRFFYPYGWFFLFLSVALRWDVALAQDAPVGDAAEEEKTSSLEETVDVAALQQRIEELESWRDDQEFGSLEGASAEMESFQPFLSIYGFMDVTLMRSWVSEKNILKNIYHEELSFTLTNLNLYFKSQMTKSISALVELRFCFLPHGHESYMPYQRYDNRVRQSNTLQSKTLGGVGIERAQATWQRYDFLGVTVGRFITPYGIWNIEHGTPVILPMYLPFVILNGIIPGAQTGLMLHGRFFPASSHYIDYAITAANNRTDVESSLDFKDNKALGLRLAWRYESPKLLVSLGGYGYYSQVNIRTKSEKILAAENTIKVINGSLDKHSELTGTVDLQVVTHGLRLHAEYARSMVKYDVHPLRIAPYFDIPMGGALIPDHVRYDAYVLLAYDLPLGKLLQTMSLTPFALVETSQTEDLRQDTNAHVVRTGLNFKPSPYWVVKLEGSTSWAPESEYFRKPTYYAGAQVAVSF
jgi:hypothetical protein